MKSEITIESIKATPPIVITSATQIFGIQLDAWVLILTAIYTGLMIVLLVAREIRKWRSK